MLNARSMTRLARLVPAAALAATAALTAAPAEAAFSVSAGYPIRKGTDRVFASTPFSVDTPNAGFNRADCFDTKQEVQLYLTDIPAEATTIEIWARRDNTSCADPTQRAGTGATTPQCYKVASWLRDEAWNKLITFKPLQVIQAIDKTTNVDDPAALDSKAVCAKDTSMPPTQIYLQIMAFNGTSVVGFTSSGGTGVSGEQVLSLQTTYDIAGPNPPADLSIGAGNNLLVANFSSTAQSTTDFKGYRAYCFPGPGGSSAALSTKGTDAGLDVLDDAAADTAVDDAATSDTGSTTTTDAGSGSRPSGCPAGDPFVSGQLPGPELDQYICGDEATSAVGKITISSFSNGARLQNGVAYAVAIGTTDKQGNSGPLSTVACGTPKETDDFYNVYRRAGGTAGGGWCAMGNGAAPFGVAGSVFALALVARIARRARTRR